MASVYLWYRGYKMSAQVKGALLAAEQRAGQTFTITQGGFNGTRVAASAGTHAGDALDLSVRGLSESQVSKMIEAMRWAGFAAWFRTTSVAKWGTRAQGFSGYHVHAVPNGWGQPSAGARRQADAYRAGRDGLARNLADIGPGHTDAYRTKTWPETLDTRTPIERLLDTMNTTDLTKLVRAAVRTELAAERNRTWSEYPAAGTPTKRPKSTAAHVLFSIQRDLRNLAAKVGK